ncbi:hypothetical protein HHK36_021948 [Tetracentron sinense]|uniref:Pectinesterase n=1 Tax=Tetracentron sinense TaxID=13715 RepID=A0A834YW58_TETSI|nr:hypothetical protein HHK36_021948 [Tetracentron sinense]
MSSFRSYGKVNEADQEKLEARRKTRKRTAIITLSSILLVGIIVAAVVGTSHSSGGNSKSSPSNAGINSLKAVCKVTLYPDSCYNSLSAVVNSSRLDPVEIFKLSIQVAMDELLRASQQLLKYGLDGMVDKMSVEALDSCNELLGLAIDHLNITLSSTELTLLEAVDDLKTWLSAAGTYQQTCIDSFENVSMRVSEQLKNSTEFTSNTLAIVTGISNLANSMKLRRLMSSYTYSPNKSPEWLSWKDRKLLQSSSNSSIKANVVVAKDGSGKYKTISEALKAVPDKSKKRFVIYVKKGVYYENVRVEKTKWNVMMIGDGRDATIVTGGLNVVDGTPTFQSATFAALGKGFIARDMGFANTAGPSKHQAVALMSTSDQSIFYRCRFDAFQDTLYAHSNRQFYRECNIYGTVDFIFGNAAVLLQNCNILPKVPMLGQQNTITAQGKLDPNQNTGTSIQNCTIWPSGNLTSVRTYLGRPWKLYSTTIYINSMMGSLIDPSGWLPWTGNSAPDTIFYSEFQNFGPGATTKNRVKWKGLRNISHKQASQFTVKSFINGDKWISETGVRYKPGL